MILWTIQSIDAWRVCQFSGTLHCDSRFIDDEFADAYVWMAEQMHKRLQYYPSRRAFPLWAWYQWDGECRRKPDLRCNGHLPRGTKGVRIEFDIDNNCVLLSDFELWHYVLNYWYLPATLMDGKTFEEKLENVGLSFYKMKPLPDPMYHNTIMESWERIFELDWYEKDLVAPKVEKSIQATLWKITMENVRRVDAFIAR